MKKFIIIFIYLSVNCVNGLVLAESADMTFMQQLYDSNIIFNLETLDSATIAFRVAELLEYPYGFNINDNSYSINIYKYAAQSGNYIKESYFKLALFELQHDTGHYWLDNWALHDSTNSLPQYLLAIRAVTDGHMEKSFKNIIKGNNIGISRLRPLYLGLPKNQFSLLNIEDIKSAKVECLFRALPLISSLRFTTGKLSKYIYIKPDKSSDKFRILLKFANYISSTRPLNFAFFEVGVSISKKVINDKIKNDPYLTNHDRVILTQVYDSHKKLVKSAFANINNINDENLKIEILDQACEDLSILHTDIFEALHGQIRGKSEGKSGASRVIH